MPQNGGVTLGRGLTLLLGGARSGKSDLAVQLGQAWPGEVTVVATATAGDEDMTARIERHQAERPADWALIESPHFDASDIVTVAPQSLLILDCITLLIANLLFADHDESAMVDHVDALSVQLAARQAPTIVISNEVGLGIHPETSMGREYRDVLGRANRAIATHAETSLFVVAGKVLPLANLDVTW